MARVKTYWLSTTCGQLHQCFVMLPSSYFSLLDWFAQELILVEGFYFLKVENSSLKILTDWVSSFGQGTSLRVFLCNRWKQAYR